VLISQQVRLLHESDESIHEGPESMASNRTVYHVVPDASATNWVVAQENGSFRKEFETKDEAVEFAKERARGQEPAQVKVHKQDGNMEYESTYGEDPARSPS
jgi:hypothetical protein